MTIVAGAVARPVADVFFVVFEAKRMFQETTPTTKELLFITVIGQDKRGIVARISGLLYESNINIEDISQRIMEGYLVMTMASDMREANRDLETLSASLQALGDDMGMQIQTNTRTCSR